MISNLFRYFSLRYLLMNPFRTFLTFLGVALGISLFLSILLLNDATLRSMDENIESMTGKADLTITSDGMGFEDSVLEKVKTLPQIKSAIPLIINYAYMENGSSGSNGPMIFLGIDLLKDNSVREYNKEGGDIIPDPLAFLNQADSIIATKSWVKRHNLEMESSIDLLTKEGLKSFAIRGMIDDIGPAKAFDGNMAIMDIDGARFNFGRDGLYDRIDLILQKGVIAKVLKNELKNLLGSRFKVEDKKEQSESMQQMVKSIQDVSRMLGLIAFLVGFLIIVNTVNTAISQRRKDIGSLRAFGAESVHIITLFAGEFIFLALCSSLLGCWIGFLIAQGSADQVAAGLNSTLFTNVPKMDIIFESRHLFSGLFLGLLSSTVALIYPLYKALQIHPIEAIRPTTVDFGLHQRPKGLVWAGRAGFLLFLFTVIAAYFSKTEEFLQNKDIQPFFLLTGISSIMLTGPYLVLVVLSNLQRLPLPFLVKFSLANLLKNPGRTASTSIHLSLGFSLVIVVSAINISFKSTIINWANVITSAPNIVNLSSWGSLSGLQVQPLHESLKEKLLTLPHLNPENKSPLTGIRIVPVTIEGSRFMIKAFDMPGGNAEFNFIDPIDGDRRELGKRLFDPKVESVLFSETMLKFFRKKVGDTFSMETPMGKATFVIAGNIREFASPNGVVYFNRDVYKKYWKDPLVTLISINHSSDISSRDYQALIGPELNKKEHLMVNLPSKISEEVEKNINNNMAMSDSTKWIALFIGTLGLLNSFLISILQRFRELGCIRSIGMTKGQLIGMILFESVTLGTTGVIIAFVLTIPIGYIWVNSTLSHLLGWKVEFYFTGMDFLILFIVGLFVSFSAGLFPALKAAKLNLREALEYE
jgi:putative ABC transport system permease protein